MEIVIFIGIQASGKTSFYRERYFDTHVRISLDQLRTRHREKGLLLACLELKQRVVVDNTNPSPEDRQRYLEPARQAGFRTVGYFFRADLQASLRLNSYRKGKARIPDAGLRSTLKRLTRPKLEEGFDELYTIEMSPGNGFVIEDWNNEI